MRLRTVVATVLAAGAVLGTAGCGLGPGDVSGETSLVVTRDFGASELFRSTVPQEGGGDTVMRLLQRNVESVKTTYNGSFVQAIDGVEGDAAAERDWFYFVNGVEAEKGAASTEVNQGDRVWWDHRLWSATQKVPAVVGSFPEPFLNGIDGKRLPTRLECIVARSEACQTVGDRLARYEIVVGRGGLQTSLTKETLRVIIGEWKAVRADAAVRSLEDGPAASGVYARPSADGRRIAVLDARGEVVRTLGAGSGIIAATRFDGGRPVWIVSGTDERGLNAAADAFEEGVLGQKYALAIENGRGVDLPAAAPRG